MRTPTPRAVTTSSPAALRYSVIVSLNCNEPPRRPCFSHFSPSRVVAVSTSGRPITAHVPLQPPAHLYTATKLAGELYCRSYGELYGLEHTILRFGIPYGPRARPGAVVPAFTARSPASP